MADTARQTSEAFGDLEFEYNLKQLLDKDPIAALGFDPAKASYTVPQGDKYGTKYSREKDTLFYGPDTGSSKDILVHEFRHRGHQLLRNEIEKNPKAFVEKYGQDVVDFLTGEFSETEGKLYPGDRQEEFRTELSDNLEATFKKPRPSEEKLLQGIKDSLGDSANLFNDEELMALAVKNYVKNVDNTGYVKDTTELVTKEDQEKYKNILTKVRQAASDILQQRKGYDQGGTVGKVLDFLTSPLTGDYRKKEPLSVQMADVGVEFTPAGTIFGINDIKEELQKEEPDYYKIGRMAGIEAIGIIPGLGDAATAAIKAGAKKAGLDKVADQTDALLSSPKPNPELEIFGGARAQYPPNMTGYGSIDSTFNAEADFKTLENLSIDFENDPTGSLVRVMDELERNPSKYPATLKEVVAGNWFRGRDDLMRFEIDDSQSEILGNGVGDIVRMDEDDMDAYLRGFSFNVDNKFPDNSIQGMPEEQAFSTLGNILKHDQLYNQYPQLRDAPVIEDTAYFKRNPSVLGYFDDSSGTIAINTNKITTNEELRDTLLHEVQHLVQHLEGFESGTNVRNADVLEIKNSGKSATSAS